MSQSVRFEQIVKIVNEFSAIGESKGLGKLYTEDDILSGRIITLKGRQMLNMGSCSYLGLELDPRLKEAAIEAIHKYGTYFSCSRIYVSCGNYAELEALLSQIFNADILLTTNSTLGHHCVMPIIIGGNDMVIYDQQAHISMQELSYKLSHFGTGVTILRHNRLDELEQKYEEMKSKYDRIWYVIDGVYSMFGDLAPIKDIIALLDKHKKLHLYVDDAHGMSWAGPNGSGYTLSQTTLHPKMILGTSMAKGFGSCGGIFAFPNREWRDKVKRWGGPLAYSGPQEPATVAAAIASAKIHLSGEIYELQEQLQLKIKFCNQIFAKYRVPLVSESQSAIFFVACGLPRVGFNLVERMMQEGFYTNIGIFPAVPETCTGVRFTLNNHLAFEDIERLARAFAHHHPRALRDENRTMKDIYTAFRKFTNFEERFGPADSFISITKTEENTAEAPIKFTQYKSISEIDKDFWNNILGNRGAFDYENMLLLEASFNDNPEPESNWKFFYFIATDNSTNKPILATYFTSSLSKDDMLSSYLISQKIEEIRKTDPYYLTSKVLMMGSQITNGDHLYIDKTNAHWQNALSLLLDSIWKIQENEKANALYLRDFDPADKDLTEFFIHQGFVKIDNLDNNILKCSDYKDFDDYFLNHLKSRHRKTIKKEALPGYENFKATIRSLTNEEIDIAYELYKNVKNNSLDLNTFLLPKNFFININNSSNWEILVLEYNFEIVACVFSCKSFGNNYSPVMLGLDYTLNAKHSLYKKVLYTIIKRGIELKCTSLYLGITANESKQKFQVLQQKQVAFIQVKDHYSQNVIDSMAYEK